MKRIIRNPSDFWAGLLFLGLGAAAMGIAAGYPMGEMRRMGPGYFPMLLGGLLAALGAIIALRALWLRGVPIGRVALRPVLIVSASIAAFAATVTHLGLVPATIALVVIASFAHSPFRTRETVVLALALAAFSAAVFVGGLGLTINLFG